MNYLLQLREPPSEIDPRIKPKKPQSDKFKKDTVVVEGVGNLMTQIAGCCQPLPGEPIQGYITQGRGVSVHREDCDQLSNLLDQHPEREIDVDWASNISASFQTYVQVFCSDRDGLLRDITTVLANEKIGLLGVNSASDVKSGLARISLRLEVKDLIGLSRVMTRIEGIKGVEMVQRTDN